MKKEIDINSIVNNLKKTKKIAWWIGEHIFLSVMVTVIISVILGYIIFHRSVISNDRLISQTEPVILFQEDNYQETIRIWETNNTRRTLIARKVYANPFEERAATAEIIDPPDEDIEEEEIEEEDPVIEDPIIDNNDFIIHTVVSSENLWILAERYLGSGFRWVEITDLDGNPYPDWRADVLSIGEQVRVPTR